MSEAAVFWSWLQGGACLAGTGVLFWQMSGHLLGTSGSLSRLLSWQDELRNQSIEAAAEADSDAFERAMMEAALQELADQGLEVPEDLSPVEGEEAVDERAVEGLPFWCGTVHRLPVECHLIFLLCLMAGGACAAWMTGRFELSWSLGPLYAVFFGTGVASFASLVLGGFLVGFGTAMAGGCTSGHGLNGCARLQPGSLLATAAFFGTAIVTSLLLRGGL